MSRTSGPVRKGDDDRVDEVVALSGHRARSGFALLSEVADVPLAALKRAMAAASRHAARREALTAPEPMEERSMVWHLDDTDPDLFSWPDDVFSFGWAEYEHVEFDAEMSLPSQHELALLEGGELVLRTIVADSGVEAQWAREPSGSAGLMPEHLAAWPAGRDATSAWLDARRVRLREFEPIGKDDFVGDLWLATVDIPTRGWTIGSAAALGVDLNNFVRSLGPRGRMDPEAMRALLVAGHVTALLGAREDTLFEAKRFIRFESTDAWEHAKDAAAFANTAAGGVIVYGLSTRKRLGYDEATAVNSFAASGQDRQLQRELDRLIVPPIEGVETILVPVGSTGEVVLVVFIPPQPAELRPFLVKGSIVDGTVNGSMIALYRRRGDDVVATSAEGLHAALAAGLALLRNAAPPS